MFNPTILSDADYDIFRTYLPCSERRLTPDLEIADGDDGVYLYRWYLVPRNDRANVYLHVQTASDPARPLHDHPWDNVSVILAGGYNEVIPDWAPQARRAGDVIHRSASERHRLVLPMGMRYSMSLFTTGPAIREWGFYCKNGWRPYHEVTELKDKRTYWKAGVE